MKKEDLDYIVGVKNSKFEIKSTSKRIVIILIIYLIISLIYIIKSIITHFFISKLNYINLVYFYIPMVFATTITVLNCRWRLVIDNNKIFIYKLFRKYQLELKNVIKIYEGRRYRAHYICILYLDNKKIKNILLYYRLRLYIQHLNDEDINELVNNFIRKNEIEKFNENEYTKIRTEDEEKKFERDLDEIILNETNNS